MDIGDTLKKVGLNEKEIEVYSLLLENGEQKISDLLQKTKLSRGDLYYALDNLVEKNLVIKEDKKKKLHFKLNHPNQLEKLLEQKEKEIKNAAAEVSAILPTIISNFNLVGNQPGVSSFEGVEGLKLAYKKLNNSGEKELLLIRSVYDDKKIEINSLINKQIKKQVQLKIRTKALTPLVAESYQTFIKYDAERLVERRLVDPKLLSLPAQILIWGDTVAIISLKKEIIATIIDNPDIAGTFKNLFQFIWQTSEQYHNKIMQQWIPNGKLSQVEN